MLYQNCPNCHTALQGKPNFCPNCSQKQPMHRITLGHFFHEVFHAFTHTDKGIFHLLKGLATKPGTVAREYVEGRRKKYFNPFTFFLIVMGLFVFSNTFFRNIPEHTDPNPAVLARIPTEAGKQQYITVMERVNKSSVFFNRHGNIVAMIAVPFMALLTWLFYRRRKYNYAEHLTAFVLFVAFSNLIFTVTIFPLQAYFKGHWLANAFLFAGLLLQALYIWWCLNGFLQVTKAGSRFRSLLVSLFCILAWMAFSMLAMSIYIYQSRDFYKFFVRMFS